MTEDNLEFKRNKAKRKKKPILAVMSLADKVKGQGVGSAYEEQLALVRDKLGNDYDIRINPICSGDVTHYHSINLRFFFHCLIHSRNTVKVGSVHFIPETLEGSIKLPNRIKKIFYKYVLKFYEAMDILVTVNPVFIEKLVELGFDRDKIQYIPNFVSDENFYRLSKENRSLVCRKIGVDPYKFTVLGVGQVQTRKGIFDFVEVAKSLPDYQFVWAGGFSFGRITDGYEMLKEIVESPPPNVKFLGIIDRTEMNAMYNIADLMFLPSYSELFPMTVLEAMQVGTPMLLRNLDLYKDILFDYYLNTDNNETFALYIKQLATDANFHSYWTNQSIKGGKQYSREMIGTRWKEFYKEAILTK